MHIYEVRPRRDKRGFDLISDALPFGRLWYGLAEDAVGYAKFYSRSHAMIVRVFDESGGLIGTHESQGAFRDVAVFGIPDPKWGEIVKACVVLKPGKTLTAEELIAYC
jgi:acyl-CoA synthetase (AMP-forming)/AMP-acid ligase II